MGEGDEFVDVGACTIERLSDKAALAKFAGKEPVWLPKSQMADVTVGDLAPNAKLTETFVKQWIAEEKGLSF